MKTKPLITRLRAARSLVREWQKAVYDSHKSREQGPNSGAVDDGTAHELARFEAAYAAITEAIKIAAKAATTGEQP